MDAFVAIGGCDKNMPGSMIAIANMDIQLFSPMVEPLHREILMVKTLTWFLFLKVSENGTW